MLWVAIVLGIVEGLTEFLPVSSTGHLIVAGELSGFTGPRAATFEVVIQLGAILAVVWDRRAVLLGAARRGPSDARTRRLAINLAVAFVPAAATGLLFHHAIKEKLFAPIPVAAALLVGGVAIIAIEKLLRPGTTVELDQVTPRQALGVGLAQVLSLWPGTSRAAATILGGMASGLSRPVATELSFLLAIPTMAAATGLDLVKGWRDLAGPDLVYLGIAFLVSFVVALVVVKALLRYVRGHDFLPFAYYRIAFAAVILATW
ncbi:MAG: undecaprenyl-diphosphate phosphatase [Acidobacteriota bacterium]